MPEEKMERTEQQHIEAVAAQVAKRVVQQDDVYRSAVQAILLAAEADVKEGALEALLRVRGMLLGKRDKEWAGIIASIWATEGTEVPANPHELRELILKWVSSDIAKLSRTKLQEGFNSGFLKGLERGTRLGWGAANVGKGLEETLQVASKEQP